MRQHRARRAARPGSGGWHTRTIAKVELLELPDGRLLEHCVSGPAGGPALLFHHGTPGACAQLGTVAAAAHGRGLRLVTSSRAGYGGSTRDPGRRIVDAARDTEYLLDALGIDRCLVAGWSGGGPHALACGARLADRVRAVLVIAGLAPARVPGFDFLGGMGEVDLLEFGLAAEGEDALRPFLAAVAHELGTISPDQVAGTLASLFAEADLAALAAGIDEDLTAQLHHGVATGVDGWIDDDLAFLADWGFALDEIGVPTTVWHGTSDLMVPVAHGRWLADHVPGAIGHLEDGHGHLSIARDADRLLEELVAVAR
jgi:pimeloyl-ACP methyl ester carboxylesterase